jgi:hypothetical protein
VSLSYVVKKSKFSRARGAYSSKRRDDRTKRAFDLEDVREATYCGELAAVAAGLGPKK